MEEKIPTLEELVAKANDLQMMPQTAKKVIDLVSKEATTAQDLAKVIEKDANITTRILKISNSAFYGLRREVTTVQHAIVILGYKSVRSLVIATSGKAMHKRMGITEQMMWDHSVGTAIFGRLIAGTLPHTIGDLAFVGGLLHNVGKAIMNNECGKAYTEVMKIVYNQGADYVDAEKTIFQYTYPEVGFRVVEKWGLPDSIVQIIRYHHLSRIDPAAKAKLVADKELKMGLACVEIGMQICQYLGIGFKAPKKDLDFSKVDGIKLLEMTPDRLKSLIEQGEKLYSQEKAIFN
jgi:HD-like signal output (HDOD) protein